MSKKRVILAILDGWGIANDPKRSAIHQAETPFIDSLYEEYPNAQLITYGEEVGLPAGQMGNSEVGHLNIGAGRIVYQELARINKEIKEGSFSKNEKLLKFIEETAKSENSRLHLMGLVSDGGVHSHINHLKALCNVANESGVKEVYIHAFMDGRDCDPRSGIQHLEDLNIHIEPMPNVHLGTVIGRYFAMDRDQRWERTKLAYDLLVNGTGQKVEDLKETFLSFYNENITDEFIPALSLKANANISKDDSVVFFNFRTDRPRQITEVLTQNAIESHQMIPLDINFATMTEYDASFKGIQVLYSKDNLKDTLGEILAKNNKTQVRIAETEKYPHVTFFFSGGQEEPFEGESRLLIPSQKVATYDLAPEMSAVEITDSIIDEIQLNMPDFICLNYANADMVGHTGLMKAAITACETVDYQLERLVNASKEDYELIIIADHGNSDILLNEDGSAHTAHTTNPVPVFLICKDKDLKLMDGKLADVAVSILERMGIEIPELMTGKNLVRS